MSSQWVSTDEYHLPMYVLRVIIPAQSRPDMIEARRDPEPAITGRMDRVHVPVSLLKMRGNRERFHEQKPCSLSKPRTDASGDTNRKTRNISCYAHSIECSYSSRRADFVLQDTAHDGSRLVNALAC